MAERVQSIWSTMVRDALPPAPDDALRRIAQDNLTHTAEDERIMAAYIEACCKVIRRLTVRQARLGNGIYRGMTDDQILAATRGRYLKDEEPVVHAMDESTMRNGLVIMPRNPS